MAYVDTHQGKLWANEENKSRCVYWKDKFVPLKIYRRLQVLDLMERKVLIGQEYQAKTNFLLAFEKP